MTCEAHSRARGEDVVVCDVLAGEDVVEEDGFGEVDCVGGGMSWGVSRLGLGLRDLGREAEGKTLVWYAMGKVKSREVYGRVMSRD